MTKYRKLLPIIFFGTASLLWMVVIFCFSAQEARESAELSGHISYRIVSKIAELLQVQATQAQLEESALAIEFPIRKLAHMSEYALLAILLFGTLYSLPGDRNAYIPALIGAFIYACSDEFHQRFVPGRGGRISDVCIDLGGAACGLLGVFLLIGIRKRMKKRKR